MPRKQMNRFLKKDLINSVRNLLKNEGLDGLDVRKISKDAGCSIGTFYNHYKNIDDLIVHFNAETIDLLQVCIFDTISRKDNAKEVIQKVCQNYITFAKDSHTAWLLLFEYPVKIPLPGWYQEKVNRIFQKVSQIFSPILRGKKTDTEKAVKVLWSSLHGICSLTLKNKLRFTEEQDALELCQDLFYHYIIGYRIRSDLK